MFRLACLGSRYTRAHTPEDIQGTAAGHPLQVDGWYVNILLVVSHLHAARGVVYMLQDPITLILKDEEMLSNSN